MLINLARFIIISWHQIACTDYYQTNILGVCAFSKRYFSDFSQCLKWDLWLFKIGKNHHSFGQFGSMSYYNISINKLISKKKKCSLF